MLPKINVLGGRNGRKSKSRIFQDNYQSFGKSNSHFQFFFLKLHRIYVKENEHFYTAKKKKSRKFTKLSAIIQAIFHMVEVFFSIYFAHMFSKDLVFYNLTT